MNGLKAVPFTTSTNHKVWAAKFTARPCCDRVGL